ncbi:hypothetical protein C8A05DRAFT_31795 [Staphylotrichum tortipilum]|uniref:Uncharacterized protein n=1 Tax=Staphylotrichum tortipilum TaxID=2831512 RepID=A0AAN6MQ66_9PEZI|nr:hypothetical protein C8A05DRAFT_31795 [Staphylotrichum longicolle]
MSTPTFTPPFAPLITPLIAPLQHISLPPSASTTPFPPTLDLRLPPREKRYLTHLARTLVTFPDAPPSPSPLALLQWRATRFFTALLRTMVALPICSCMWDDEDEIINVEKLEEAFEVLVAGEHDEGEDITTCAWEMGMGDAVRAVWWLVEGRREWMEGGDGEGWWEEKLVEEGLVGEGRLEKMRGLWELVEQVDAWIGVLERVKEWAAQEEAEEDEGVYYEDDDSLTLLGWSSETGEDVFDRVS